MCRTYRNVLTKSAKHSKVLLPDGSRQPNTMIVKGSIQFASMMSKVLD